MSELTIQRDGSLLAGDHDHSAGAAAVEATGADGVQPRQQHETAGSGEDSIRSKPLIELLKIAEVMGVIGGWSVSGASLVLRRGEANILVRAVDAGGLLVRLMAEKSP